MAGNQPSPGGPEIKPTEVLFSHSTANAPLPFSSSGEVNSPCGNASLRCAFAAPLAADVGVGDWRSLPMSHTAELISVGTELLLGSTANAPQAL